MSGLIKADEVQSDVEDETKPELIRSNRVLVQTKSNEENTHILYLASVDFFY